MNRPEQCLASLLYKQTRKDNKLDYSSEIGGIYAWITTYESNREMELIDKILAVLCNCEPEEWELKDIEKLIESK